MRRWILGGLALCLAISTVGVVARPTMLKPFADEYKGTYPKDSALSKASCTACHIGLTPKLNPYGADLDKKLKELKSRVLSQGLKGIEALDSDKDGVTNKAEIVAGTLPGDSKSTPPRK